MSHGIYDIFAGKGDVQVFSTEEKKAPKKLPAWAVKAVVPFMLASFVTGTAEAENPAQSRLPDKEISALMQVPDTLSVHDTDYNHFPESIPNFWNMVMDGMIATREVQSQDQLTQDQKKEYTITARKMLSRVKCDKAGGNVDLTDPDNLKAFIYFEKVARYREDYTQVFPDKNYIIDERNELLGQYSLDYAALKEKVQQNDNGILRFSKALYASDKKFILSGEDREKCNEMSLEYLANWFKENNISEEDVVWHAPKATESTPNYFALNANQWDRFRAKMVINPTGELLNNLYSPVGCNIIHETQHMMQVDFKSRSNYSDYTAELGPTLYSLMLNDEIYKKIHGIDLQEQVDYGNIYVPDGNSVAIGEIANRFREIVQKHPSKSVDKIVAEPEMIQQMAKWGAYSEEYLILQKYVRTQQR